MSIDSDKRLKQLKEERCLPGPAVRNVFWLQGRLTTRTGLHIGSGTRPAGDTDGEGRNLQLVMLEAPQAGQIGGLEDDPSRKPDGSPLPGCFPYIPATSLRGVLRSWIGGMLGPYGPPVASFNGQGGINISRLEDASRTSSDAKTPEDLADPDVIDQKRAEYLQSNLDLVAGLFGSTYWRSKVEVDPARIDRSKIRSDDVRPLLYRVPRVAIDPHLGAAEDRKLFETELVRPGAQFLVTMRAQNVMYWELGLLLLALDSFNHRSFPTRIGGHTQQGCGELQFDLERVEQLGANTGRSVLDDWISSQRSETNDARVPKVGAFKSQCIEALAKVCREAFPMMAAG
jgi:CRISPR/Cas system CSM-associated protein Csm3 (group 7 of RAMP superfamily)